jgi:hypothetical protein
VRISGKVKTLGLGTLVAAIIIVVGASIATNQAAALAGSLSIDPASQSVQNGSQFKLSIRDNADVVLTGAQTDFSFDQTKLSIKSVVRGTDWTGSSLTAGVAPQTLAQAITEANTTGTLKNLTLFFSPGAGSVAVGNHVFVSITMTANSCGEATLNLGGTREMLDIDSNSITPSTSGGSVTVKCPEPTTTPTQTTEPTVGPAPTSTPTPSIPASTGTTGVNGSVPPGTLQITVPPKVQIPLERGTLNTQNVKVMIDSNTPWSLSASDPKATNKGYMTTADVPPLKLANSMKVAVGATVVDLTLGGKLSNGAGDSSVVAQLRQLVVPGDLPGAYHIDVLFQAVGSF